MLDVLIVVEPVSSEVTAQMVSAFKAAILAEQVPEGELTRVAIVSSTDLSAGDWKLNKALLCPFTLHLPATIAFPAQAIYCACRNVEGLRQQLTEWQYATGPGEFWLPIVLTAKGPLYAEVIGVKADTLSSAKGTRQAYTQPIHLTDTQRQPLYALGQRLLRSLNAPPAVYLMQFGWQADALCFDRLLPFPDAPALASLNVQTPNLYACHWLCLSGQPVVDLAIKNLGA